MKPLQTSDALRQAIGTEQATTRLTHLQRLEAESIYIFREVVTECEFRLSGAGQKGKKQR